MKSNTGFGLLIFAILLAAGGTAALAALQPEAQTVPWLGSLAALGVAVLMMITHLLMAASAQKKLEERRRLAAEAESKRHNEAVMKLLDGITSLANGDLTGEVAVTEDFTGSLADCLNSTVQTLRELVGTINASSKEISSAALTTTATTQQMTRASDDQAHEIAEAAKAIQAASASLEGIAADAESVAAEAKSSVAIAHNGAATVGRTIVGMSALREQIQDTAKRIKRLGESSQEIGEIIEFIDEIAEQTNMLALNASIQAATAGEAGRGFAVVAEQVQQLAERASNYTRQVESLVKTIQTDTQEAITSMERSTGNVVSGAQNAEEAGLALTRVEAASQQLAEQIEAMTLAARRQSSYTTQLASKMQEIRGVSVQSSIAAAEAAESVGRLNVLAGGLQKSVAGFKLPQ